MKDLEFPDRVIIGCNQSKGGLLASEILAGIYERWIPKEKIITSNIWSSELSKLVRTLFWPSGSSINSISALCEKTDADITEFARRWERITASVKNF